MQISTPSCSAVVLPTVGAVNAANQFLGQEYSAWNSVNDAQRQLGDAFADALASIGLFRPGEYAAIADRDVSVVNRFLAERGFNIKLDPMRDPKAFGAAAAMKVLVRWTIPGTLRPIVGRDGAQYPGFRMKGGVAVLASNSFDQPIARLTTKSEDTVYVMKYSGPTGFWDLAKVAERVMLSAATARVEYDYTGIHVPMVDFDTSGDLDWLCKMWLTGSDGEDYEIAQAKFQAKLKMNEKGALAEAAVAVGVMRCLCVPPPEKWLVFDEPFLFVMTRPGMSTPYFVAYLGPDSWKNPGPIAGLE